MSLRSFGQRKSLLIIYAKLFLNTIINGKSQTLLSDFFEVRGGCTQANALCSLCDLQSSDQHPSRYNIKGIYLKAPLVMVAVRGGCVCGWVGGRRGVRRYF